jgi:hypothetical protein
MGGIPHLSEDKIPGSMPLEDDGLGALAEMVPFRQDKYYPRDPITKLDDIKGEDSIHTSGQAEQLSQYPGINERIIQDRKVLNTIPEEPE